MVLLINLVQILQLIIFVRVILTWVMPSGPPPPLNHFTRHIDKVLKRFRVVVPMGRAYMDFGPMLILIVLYLLQGFLISLV